MFGPLPALHRFVLVLAAVGVCLGIGFWLGAMPEIPLNLRVGLVVGAAPRTAAAGGGGAGVHHEQGPRRARRRPRETAGIT